MNLVCTPRTTTALNLCFRVAVQSFQFFVNVSGALQASSELASRLQYVLRMNGRRENVEMAGNV